MLSSMRVLGMAMSKTQGVLAGILPILFLILVIPSAFAEPTPYGEWDLDLSFSDVTAKQNPSDLHSLEVTVRAKAIGTMPESTVNIYADITGPDGTTYTTFGTIHDIKRGSTGILRLPTTIADEGIYLIDVRMTSVGQFTDHVFDKINLEHTVPEHGFENLVSTVGTETDVMITYHVEDPSSIKYYEALHASILIDDVMSQFEMIVITDSDGFRKDYPLDTKDIYLTSDHGYEETKVHLLKEGKLFPIAYAQNSVQEYVQFYTVNKDQCTLLKCDSVNQVSGGFEFEPWILMVMGLGGAGIAGIALWIIFKNCCKPKNYIRGMKD